MRILHIVGGNIFDGASRGAYWLHQGLIKSGIDSKILTNSESTYDDSTVITINKNKLDHIINKFRIRIDKLATLLYPNRKRQIFSTGIIGFDFIKSNEYLQADIVHLHWINSGFVNIRDISKIDKPIVWTMRDMWPMTGGCHYSMDCQNYKYGCGQCKQLNSKTKYDISRYVLKRKKRFIPNNIIMVGISEWLSNQARESLLFNDFDIRTIHNAVNTTDYSPINKKLAREKLGLNTDKKVILTGSINNSDYYKGFDKYVESLIYLDNQKFHLCFFGKIDKSVLNKLDFEYTDFGYLQDKSTQRNVYSCADVFVSPSKMDAFGKTLVEAMACGTPVVCFNSTGPRDIVNHHVNGYKAKPYDAKSMARGIEWIISSPNYEEISLNARNTAVNKFDSKVISEKYLELYTELLDNDKKR